MYGVTVGVGCGFVFLVQKTPDEMLRECRRVLVVTSVSVDSDGRQQAEEGRRETPVVQRKP